MKGGGGGISSTELTRYHSPSITSFTIALDEVFCLNRFFYGEIKKKF